MAGPTNTQFAVAVHVLTMLADAHAQTGTDALSSDLMAGSTGSNPVYLRRVLGRLREVGLVGSRPGPRGGWHLEREPEAITLGDAWRAVQEGAPIFGLHTVQPECLVGSSIAVTLTALDDQLTRNVEAELDRTTIADIVPAGASATLAASPVA